MTAPTLRLLPGRLEPASRASRPVRGPATMVEALLDWGALSSGDLARAVALQVREDTHLRDILIAHRMASATDVAQATALEWDTTTVDLTQRPPDPRLIDRFGADRCLRDGFVPWRQLGSSLVLATARPEGLARSISTDPEAFGECHMVIAAEAEIEAAIVALRRRQLARRAEARVPDPESCRNWGGWQAGAIGLFLFALAVFAFALAPRAAFAVLALWAAVTLCLNMGVKAAAAWMVLRRGRPEGTPAAMEDAPAIAKLPKVSILVPLFKEVAIARRLVANLKRLEYPKELLDICLVIEADDHQTRQTLAETRLPFWVRTIIVPDGVLKTKPRALNYALDFCKGSIIGVYDAEDAPEPDQIHKVVRRFHERGPEVACLQGILDFYNARTNWLSRCFTIEYATWFRVVLPGFQHLGLAIPLGGTTLFFRREALERLGAWDAHNVTEDADLGIRLARHGYRTETLETVTEEEANCRAIPWIKQRSRWLKGYAITWAVHMRAPRQLWRDLGAWRFFGVQLLFAGTLSQFVLAPLLWSFWLVFFGLPHPLSGYAPSGLLFTAGILFFASELLNIVIGLWAVGGEKHRWLRPWVPTLQLYFPLGALASYKGLWEVLTRPFYWDKTAHGVFPETPPAKTIR